MFTDLGATETDESSESTMWKRVCRVLCILLTEPSVPKEFRLISLWGLHYCTITKTGGETQTLEGDWCLNIRLLSWKRRQASSRAAAQSAAELAALVEECLELPQKAALSPVMLWNEQKLSDSTFLLSFFKFYMTKYCGFSILLSLK